MSKITKLIINECKMKDIDFMGYYFNKDSSSFHHLILPKRLGGEKSLRNGVVLNKFTSHPYLHIVEKLDFEIYDLITLEMIEQNKKRKIDIDNLKRINKLLLFIEEQYGHILTPKGKLLIKEEYRDRFTKFY